MGMKLFAGLIVLACCLVANADWPQWLGPTRDGKVPASSPVPTRLPGELKILWRTGIGGGFSSPVVSGKRLVYFDEDGTDEVLHAVDSITGKEIWKRAIAPKIGDEWGQGPRSTPFIDGERVYCISGNGEFRCLELSSGKVIWGTSFEKDYGVKFLGSKAREGTAARRGNNGSGMVDGNDVLVPVGSTNGASMVCLDKMTGRVIWKSGNDEAAYSSMKVADIDGVRQVVAFTADALVGFNRKDGKILWRVPLKTNAKRHTGTPIISGNNVFVNSHTFGTICFDIRKSGDGFVAREKWVNKDAKVNLSTPILHEGHLYSQGPLQSRTFICLDASNGEQKWSAPGFGKDSSSVLLMGRNLLALTDEGQLVLVAGNPANYEEISRLQVAGKNWNFPAYSDGKLFVRDQKELLCIDLLQQVQ